MRKTYTAVARRRGGWWAISVPQLKGVHTQARRLDQVEWYARDAIALFLDVPPDSFAVIVEPEVPHEVSHALAQRQAAREAERRADDATALAIDRLIAAGFTVRDAGRLLDLSPQRVSQISRAERAKAS
jgi:predicted RNase H-like HicB family nuclease